MSVPAFHEVRFPVDYAGGTSGGPMYSTRLVVVDSGAEQRVQMWSRGRLTFDIGYTANPADFDVIIAFFRARKGRAFGFRFKDWSDYKATAAPLGNATAGQLTKTYSDAGGNEVRKITKPVAGTVVFRDATNTVVAGTADPLTGLYTISAGTPPFTWTGEFDVPVRFDIDKLVYTQEGVGSRSLQSLPIVEILI